MRTCTRWACLLAGLVVLACVLLPASAPARWLSQLPLIAHALAFPVVSGLIVLGLALVSRQVVWVLAGLALLVLPQGWPAFSAGGELTVLSFNTMDTLTEAGLAELIDAHDPDLLVLPEASLAQPPADYALVSSPGADGVAPTLMLVHARLGSVREVTAPEVTWGAVAVSLADGTVLAGVHPTAPVPGQMAAWRHDLRAVEAWARDHDRLILAGDFNATLRHGPLASLDLVQGDWCGGTWPAPLPSWLASPIDHVLVSPDIGVGDCQTVRIGQSDHRAVVAQVG